MKKTMLVLGIILCSFFEMNAQVEYKVITSVESIVPNGLGRSRLISNNEEKVQWQYTQLKQKKTTPGINQTEPDIRIKNFDETKLLNFYNIAGIRFQNLQPTMP